MKLEDNIGGLLNRWDRRIYVSPINGELKRTRDGIWDTEAFTKELLLLLKKADYVKLADIDYRYLPVKDKWIKVEAKK